MYPCPLKINNYFQYISNLDTEADILETTRGDLFYICSYNFEISFLHGLEIKWYYLSTNRVMFVVMKRHDALVSGMQGWKQDKLIIAEGI